MERFAPDLDVRPSNNREGMWVVYNRLTGHALMNPGGNGDAAKSYFRSENAARAGLADWQRVAAERAEVEASRPVREPAVKGWKKGGFHPVMRSCVTGETLPRGKDEEGFDLVPRVAYRHPSAPGLVVHKGTDSRYIVAHELSGLAVMLRAHSFNLNDAKTYALMIANLTDWTSETVTVSRDLTDGVRAAQSQLQAA